MSGQSSYLARHHDEGNGQPVALEDLSLRADKGEVEADRWRWGHRSAPEAGKTAGGNSSVKISDIRQLPRKLINEEESLHVVCLSQMMRRFIIEGKAKCRLR